MRLQKHFADKTTERLMRYARINTQSSTTSKTTPTTVCQFNLARILAEELKDIGAADVYLDETTCVVYGKVPANISNEMADAQEPAMCMEHGISVKNEMSGDKGSSTDTCHQRKISNLSFGLVTHMDTSPEAPSEDVKPWLLENYQGGDILLNKEKNIVMEETLYPNLKNYIGQDLVLTDGTTLLGGDDKAGIAAVMTFAEYLLAHPEIPHGDIALAFTPDEEVGGLARDLDLKRFGAPVCYTLDGDYLGVYADETFNASEACLKVKGLNVHPGTAKNIMVNAVDICAEFITMLPVDERPQTTSGREGFYHVIEISGTVENASLRMIIRDHDGGKFVKREDFVKSCADRLAEKYGAERITLTITETYRSMKEIIDKVPYTVEYLKAAMEEVGLTPKNEPFRGGTDGSALSWRGLPAVNLSAGYENAHGRFEYVPVQAMVKNVEILLALTKMYAGTEGNHA